MAHFRKVIINQKEYEYKVGKKATFIKEFGIFSHEKIGYCHDVSMGKFSVSPRAVRIAINQYLKEASKI